MDSELFDERARHGGARESREYWDGEALRFDGIYNEDGSVRGLLNKTFRGDMEGRLRFALSHSRLASSPDILEIGCGTGIHTKAFVDSGAASVTAIDMSPVMLRIASARLNAPKNSNKYAERTTLIEGDFMKAEFNRTFDAATAIGVFDYIEDSAAFLRRALDASSLVIATFPRAGTLRALARRVRLSLKGCPVYFYTREKLETMAVECGANISAYEEIGQLHCAVFEKKPICS
jgi:SAM-dependent methyltransferase